MCTPLQLVSSTTLHNTILSILASGRILRIVHNGLPAALVFLIWMPQHISQQGDRDRRMNARRSFLETLFWSLCALVGAAISGAATAAACSPVFRKPRGTGERLELGRIDQLEENVPLARRIEVTQQDGWGSQRRQKRFYLVKSAGRVIVFAPVCTHLGCQVEWESRDRRFHCPCHGGRFDLQGRAVAGPPPRPLQRIPAEVQGSKIYIRLV